jgi:hypothetical protein
MYKNIFRTGRQLNTNKILFSHWILLTLQKLSKERVLNPPVAIIVPGTSKSLSKLRKELGTQVTNQF